MEVKKHMPKTLWKYMDLSKFLNLLSGKLYFNNVFNFEDVFECRIPTKRDKVQKVYRKEQGEWKLVADESRKALVKVEEDIGKRTFVCCFHKNECESAFMWKLYAENKGVAIKTTEERIRESLGENKKRIVIKPVDYMDYKKTNLLEEKKSTPCYQWAFCKRASFKSEEEVRCLFFDENNVYNGKTGILFPVDLNILIDEIYVSPYAPQYLRDDIERVVTLHKLNARVIYSELNILK